MGAASRGPGPRDPAAAVHRFPPRGSAVTTRSKATLVHVLEPAVLTARTLIHPCVRDASGSDKSPVSGPGAARAGRRAPGSAQTERSADPFCIGLPGVVSPDSRHTLQGGVAPTEPGSIKRLRNLRDPPSNSCAKPRAEPQGAPTAPPPLRKLRLRDALRPRSGAAVAAPDLSEAFLAPAGAYLIAPTPSADTGSRRVRRPSRRSCRPRNYTSREAWRRRAGCCAAARPACVAASAVLERCCGSARAPC